MAAERCSKTTDVMVLAAIAVCFRLSRARRRQGRPKGSGWGRRTLYALDAFTTASRWGRRSWPLLVGRMRWYRVGRTSLYDCSHWLLTSRNTVCEALWMVTNGSSLSSRSNQWTSARTTVKRTGQGRFQPGGNSAEGAGCRVPPDSASLSATSRSQWVADAMVVTGFTTATHLNSDRQRYARHGERRVQEPRLSGYARTTQRHERARRK